MSTDEEIVFEFKKNSRECVRASLKHYQGRRLLDLRVHYYDEQAQTWKPNSKGLSLQVNAIENLKTAVAALADRIAAEAVSR